MSTGRFYFLHYVAGALVLGETPGRGWSEPRAVGVAGFVAAGLVGGLLLGGRLGTGQDLVQAWDAQWQVELETLLGGYQRLGLNAEQAAQAERGLTEVGRMLLRLTPGLLTAGSLLLVWANLVLARRTSRGAGGVRGPFEPVQAAGTAGLGPDLDRVGDLAERELTLLGCTQRPDRFGRGLSFSGTGGAGLLTG